jgi:NTP pyrophosphatase (non-canonical NTP hydrolase)
MPVIPRRQKSLTELSFKLRQDVCILDWRPWVSVHIHEFQEMMRRIYLRDSERGVSGTYNWLKDEVKELGEALKTNDKAALESEFADVIAWLASLANVANVDLETAAHNKYDGKCPKCGYSPCQCAF